jgi:hypothetical protein
MLRVESLSQENRILVPGSCRALDPCAPNAVRISPVTCIYRKVARFPSISAQSVASSPASRFVSNIILCLYFLDTTFSFCCGSERLFCDS